MYVAIWQFTVAPAHATEFERVYGASGDWDRLFRRAEGFLGTELLRRRDAEAPTYVTVDRWRSEADFAAFRESLRSEYDALDGRCARLALSEAKIGAFETAGS